MARRYVPALTVARKITAGGSQATSSIRWTVTVVSGGSTGLPRRASR